MKLSEAIRKGFQGRERAHSVYFTSDFTACCALGAAFLGDPPSEIRPGNTYEYLVAKYPVLQSVINASGEKLANGIIRWSDSDTELGLIIELVMKFEKEAETHVEV